MAMARMFHQYSREYPAHHPRLSTIRESVMVVPATTIGVSAVRELCGRCRRPTTFLVAVPGVRGRSLRRTTQMVGVHTGFGKDLLPTTRRPEDHSDDCGDDENHDWLGVALAGTRHLPMRPTSSVNHGHDAKCQWRRRSANMCHTRIWGCGTPG